MLQAYREDGDDLQFDHYSVILEKGTSIFIAKSQRAYVLYRDISISDLDCPLILISADDIWPSFTNDLTPATYPIPDNVFIKRPRLFDYDPETNIVKSRELLLHEVQICELLRKHPHKNVGSYLGCVKGGDSVTSLCFVKSKETISERLEDFTRPLNLDTCLTGVKEGLDHLHSLDSNHNDDNPANIMFDGQDVPIIIDFNSCQLEGKSLFSTGTPGWTDHTTDRTKSERKNDDFALKQLSGRLTQGFSV